MQRLCKLLILLVFLAGCGWHGERGRADVQGVREDVFPVEEDRAVAAPKTDAAGSVSQLKKVLDADIGWAGDGLFAAPAVSDGLIFTGDGRGRVTALAKDGKPLWRANVGRSSIGGVLPWHDRLFVTTTDGMLAALDKADGRLLWSVRLGAGSFNRPAVLAARVVAMTIGDTVEAFTISRGEEVWRYSNFSFRAALDRHAAPIMDNGTVVAALPGGSIVRIDGHSGSVITLDVISDSDSDFHPASSTPIVADGYTYAVAYTGRLCAIGNAAGSRRWCQDVNSVRDIARLGDNLIISTTRGEVMSISMRDGHIAWGAKIGRNLTAPVVFGDDIAVASGRDIFVLDGSAGISVQKYTARRAVAVLAYDGGLLLAVLDNASIIGLQ
ncbi:MAG: PQQ-binding-like beta-propeller repeat protein [Alphaproteobacteria bacterium]|nr:PQQ-binding-like beta-propeller repeat protein [Alphaproteobacteria bacterium]